MWSAQTLPVFHLISSVQGIGNSNSTTKLNPWLEEAFASNPLSTRDEKSIEEEEAGTEGEIQTVPFQFLDSHVKGQPQLGNAISGAIKENSMQGMRLFCTQSFINPGAF